MLKTLWLLVLWITKAIKSLYAKIRNKRASEDSANPRLQRIAFDPASQAIESIHQFVNARSARIIGLIGVDHDSGVTSAAEALATRYARGGKRALLIDASGLASSSPQAGDEQIEASSSTDDPNGYSRASLRPSADELLQMRDIARLKKILRVAFQAYDIIIIDTPPARDVNGHALPATIVAKACDAVLLVCLTANVTRTLIEEACANLRAVDAPLAGVVLNRREQPTLGAEIAREARRFRKWLPKTSEKLELRALSSTILNIHA